MLNAKNVERDSNFELLRIVAMLMIIGHHLALYGAPCDDPSYISPNILLSGHHWKEAGEERKK